MSEVLLFFSGIDGATGSYDLPHMRAEKPLYTRLKGRRLFYEA